MKTGFYNLEIFKTDEELKGFFQDCINNAYQVRIDVIKEWTRERNQKYTIKDILDLVKVTNHNVFIDRSVQYKEREEFEAAFRDKEDNFLFIHLTLDKGKELTNKYNLIDGTVKTP
jgi:hypothetical protein